MKKNEILRMNLNIICTKGDYYEGFETYEELLEDIKNNPGVEYVDKNQPITLFFKISLSQNDNEDWVGR